MAISFKLNGKIPTSFKSAPGVFAEISRNKDGLYFHDCDLLLTTNAHASTSESLRTPRTGRVV